MLHKINNILFNLVIAASVMFCVGITYAIVFDLNKDMLNRTIYTTFVAISNQEGAINGAGSVINAWEDDGKYYAYVLTAGHVVRPDPSKPLPDRVVGKFILNKNGAVHQAAGTVQEYFQWKDFCILKYQLDYLSNYVSYDTNETNLLDKVYLAGMPNSSFWVTSGTVASTFSNNEGFISHNAPGFYGNSGGPLFNSRGYQIGVNLMVGVKDISKTNHITVPIPNINYAINMKEISHTLGKEKFNRYFGRGK